MLQLGSDFRREVSSLFIDALTECEPTEARYPNRLAGAFGGRLDDLGHPALAVDHVDLLEQDALFIKLAQAPLDHPLDDRDVLAARGGLLAQDGALALQRRRRDRGGVEIERAGGGDMHRQLPAETSENALLSLGFERYEDSDLAETGRQRVMHVRGHNAAADL